MKTRDEKVYMFVRSILTRQINHRPTTLYQVYIQHSIGVDWMKGILEKEKVRYILVPHGEKFRINTTEILIYKVPKDILEVVSTRKHGKYYVPSGITKETIRESFAYFSKELKLKKHAVVEYRKVRNDSPGQQLSPEEQADPYFKYRITKEEFEVLKSQLIKRNELMRIAKEKGYTYNQIRRAVGEPKMRFKLVNEKWRPYVYQGDRYFHINVLDILYESDKTYATPFEGRQQRLRRLRESPDFKDPMKFTSRKELFDNLERLEKTGDSVTFDLSYYLIR